MSSKSTNKEKQINNFLDKIIAKLMFKWSRTKSMQCFIQAELAELCFRAREMLWLEPICLDIEAPVRIVGDLHGQFEDVLGMFDLHGWPLSQSEISGLKAKVDKKKTAQTKTDSVAESVVPKYLFLGDYVDRGPYSIEVVTLFLALKLRFPTRIYLLRGNHESRPVNNHYGFFRECKYRYCAEIYECFQNVFNCLPFAAVINKSIMCMHGGISSHLVNFEQFNAFNKPLEIPDIGILADLTWADPDPSIEDYAPSPRGASFVFGSNALRSFLKKLNLQLIVRAHQVVEDGYEFFDERHLVTIFSAPNYCGDQNNTSAIMCVSSTLEINFVLFRPDSRECERKK